MREIEKSPSHHRGNDKIRSEATTGGSLPGHFRFALRTRAPNGKRRVLCTMSRSGPQVSMTLARPPDYTGHLKQNLEAIFLKTDALVHPSRLRVQEKKHTK